MMQPTSHPCPPWTLRAWPPLLWQVESLRPLHLRHLGTRITSPGDPVNRPAGQTLWAVPAGDGQAGMAWDWVQLSRGIVTMADPLSVITNISLVGPQGNVLPPLESLRHLNEVVHSLPWQAEVERVLSEGEAGG
jgi:hypothetical protein